jgi:hypothetical protein
MKQTINLGMMDCCRGWKIILVLLDTAQKNAFDTTHTFRSKTVEHITHNYLNGDMGAVNFDGLDCRSIGFGMGFSALFHASWLGRGNNGFYRRSGVACAYF